MNTSFRSLSAIAPVALRRFGIPSLALIQLISFTPGLKAEPIQPLLLAEYVQRHPPSRGAPGTNGGGGSRGCGDQHLIALVPTYETKATSGPVEDTKETDVWGVTISDHPTLWFYVPYTNSASEVEFVLKDESDTTIYKTPISTPETPGIISVRLPSTTPALKPEQMYHWFLKAKYTCDPTQPLVQTARDFVEGWIQRTDPDAALVAKLKQASPRQQADLYAESGIWYDAITSLAELRLANPKDAALAEEWTDVLKFVGKDTPATQPITHCCNPK